MVKKTILVLLLAFTLTTVFAATDIVEDECDHCFGTGSCMAICLQNKIGTEDSKLNKIYQRLLKSLSDSDKSNLIKAERAWLTFRQSNCHFYGRHIAPGGIMGAVYSNSCVLTMTVERAKFLSAVIDNKNN